jgi:O-antigen/teichoic acid export membrane protein
MVLGMYLFASKIILILYSAEFLNVLMVLKIALFGLIFKTIAWPIGFISLVKGNKKLFFKQNLLSDFVNVICSVVLTYFYGLIGLGIAFGLVFLMSFLYNLYTVSKNYQFYYSNETKQVIGISILFGMIALISFIWFDFSYTNPIMIILFCISALFSLYKIRKNINL